MPLSEINGKRSVSLSMRVFSHEGKKDTSGTIKAYNFGASIGDLHFYGIYSRAGVGCGGGF